MTVRSFRLTSRRNFQKERSEGVCLPSIDISKMKKEKPRHSDCFAEIDPHDRKNNGLRQETLVTGTKRKGKTR